jgi:hypothetical protein
MCRSNLSALELDQYFYFLAFVVQEVHQSNNQSINQSIKQTNNQ